MHALKRAPVITKRLAGLDPRKSHGTEAFRASLSVDLWNFGKISF